ncbi:MAG: helix-turn-helix transcriptional regulator [Candidatus Omnitrophica bacterium]|nr:helix-turn-helix transcriptional regulator [Candidatus Omnitrophota bacterium]
MRYPEIYGDILRYLIAFFEYFGIIKIPNVIFLIIVVKLGKSRRIMIGDNIKRLRKKKGLSQDNLARKADMPYATLIKIESNVVKKPSVQNVVKIAEALEVKIEDLLKD